MEEEKFEVGSTVRVSNKYWLECRRNQIGTIIKIVERGENRLLVEFPARTGGGFDGGRHLFMSERQVYTKG